MTHRTIARPTRARPAAAKDPMDLLAAPVNGALPVPLGATGEIGEPVADGPDPAPELELGPLPDDPVPVGLGTPVPVANPVGPVAPEELRLRISVERRTGVPSKDYLTDVVLVHEHMVS